MTQAPDIPVNLALAERFLALLDPLGKFTFQTFDDSPEKRKEMAKVLHGTLGQRGAALKKLNEGGAGVFVTVNATDLKSDDKGRALRKADNVTAVRALFVDLDGAPIQPVRDGPLEPQIQVESSPGRWHAYWLVKDVALAQFRPLQRGLLTRFNGDPTIHDLSRVMRIPGFVHRKAVPALSLLSSCTDRAPYTLAEVLAAFGWGSAEAADPGHAKPRAAPRAPLAPSGDDDVIDDLVEALEFIPADGYEEWKNVAFALKTLGSRGEPLFHDWASRSSKYDEKVSSKHWAQVQPTQTSYQAVFKLAQQFGWDASNSPSIRRKWGRAASREQGPIAPMPPDELLDAPPAAEIDDENEEGDEPDTPPIELPPEPPKTLEGCLARFELVYGGNKAFDTATSQEITIFGLQAMVGKDLIKAWLADTSKRVRVPGTGAKSAKPEKKKPKGDPTKLAMLLERYALIYTTEAVFDRLKHVELTLGALRAFAGLQAVRAWTDHPHRKVVDVKQIVFDPRIALDDPDYCNVYKGWPTAASKGDAGDQDLCRRWRAVVYYAVNSDDVVFDWLMKWMAYQVRYPGTKMKTSVIMHGNEGSGKNTIWDAFRRIFGDYGRSITQVQLESQYTDWIGGKFFIVGNEVLHKQEQVQQKGRLKTLITEDEVSVERKFLPGREEPNYCNLVFLSNEKTPLSIDPDDRRFLVVWTPPPHKDGAAFYQGLAQKEMPGSAVSAIYHYLLNEVELGDFGPHSKPPMTKAKSELIDASLPSAPRFMRDWMAGELEVPYMSCKTLSLYAAYLYWCRGVGERYPWPENRFGADAKKILAYGKKHYFDGQVQKQSMFYLVAPDTRPPEQSEAAWLAIQQERFVKALSAWRGEQ